MGQSRKPLPALHWAMSVRVRSILPKNKLLKNFQGLFQVGYQIIGVFDADR